MSATFHEMPEAFQTPAPVPVEELPSDVRAVLQGAFARAASASRELRRRLDEEELKRRAEREGTRRAAVSLVCEAVDLLRAAPSHPVRLPALIRRKSNDAMRDRSPLAAALSKEEEVLQIAVAMLSTPAAREAGLVLRDGASLTLVAAPASAK